MGKYGSVVRRRRCPARRALGGVLVGAVLVGIASSSWAIFVSPRGVPIDRVIANVEARLSEDPSDVDALYTLARAHYLAFVYKSPFVPGYLRAGADENDLERWLIAGRWMTEPGPDERPGFYMELAWAEALALQDMGLSDWSEVPEERVEEFRGLTAEHARALGDENWSPAPMDVERVLEHAEEALVAFEAVIERAPANGLYRLGLASLYDQYVQFRERNAPPEGSRLRAIGAGLTQETYYQAYALSVDGDRSRDALPLAGLHDLVSYEAGTRFLELAEERFPNPSPQQQERREQVRAGVEAVRRIPQRSVTPLVLSLQAKEGLAALIDDDAEVWFDLDGDDAMETWTWVRPSTGILTWDPWRTGEITSGRQLFGNATWWLLFADGYRALDTLDDDRDGYVSGLELDGLAVWFDRNGNGRSERGEVVPVEHLPIRALGTRPDGEELGGPRHSRGLVLADGQVLPTWDWIAHRVVSEPCRGACSER